MHLLLMVIMHLVHQSITMEKGEEVDLQVTTEDTEEDLMTDITTTEIEEEDMMMIITIVIEEVAEVMGVLDPEVLTG